MTGQPLADGDSQAAGCQFMGDRFSRLLSSLVDLGVSVMVDPPSQLKGFGRGHAGNVLAKQVNDLLIRVTIAIVHDHFGFKITAGTLIGFLFRDFRHFCGGKITHAVCK